MGELRPARLARYRARQDAHLPDQCRRWRRVVASDGIAGQTITYVDDGLRACRIGVPSRAEQETAADRFTSVPRAIVTLTWDTDVVDGDRLELVTGTQADALVDVIGRISTLESWETCARMAVLDVPDRTRPAETA